MDTLWWPKDIGRAGADKVREAARAMVPLRIASTAEDVAEMVLFLADPATRNMTGELAVTDANLHLAGR